MRTKSRIKKRAKNEYSALTGRRAFSLLGGQGCIIIDTKNNILQRRAYFEYENIPLNTSIKVTNTCGIDNCVRREHLIAKYHPNKEDVDYIKSYLNADGPEMLSFRLKVPLKLLKEYIENGLS